MVKEYGKYLALTILVKESGMTVHLIAKTQTQENNNTTSSTTNTQQQGHQPNRAQTTGTNHQTHTHTNTNPPNNQQSTSNVNSNPFMNILGALGGGSTQMLSMNNNDLNAVQNSLGNILGGFGINIGVGGPNGVRTTFPPIPGLNPPQQQTNVFQTPPNNNSRRQENQPQQPTSTFSFNIPPIIPPQNIPQTQPTLQQPSNQPLQPGSFSVSTEPILNLNQVISTLNLPTEPVLDNSHLSLR